MDTCTGSRNQWNIKAWILKMYSRSAKGGEKGDPNRNPWLAKMMFVLLPVTGQDTEPSCICLYCNRPGHRAIMYMFVLLSMLLLFLRFSDWRLELFFWCGIILFSFCYLNWVRGVWSNAQVVRQFTLSTIFLFCFG